MGTRDPSPPRPQPLAGRRRLVGSLVGGLVGAVPGLVLLVLAPFVVGGEQLVVSVVGLSLAPIGALVGVIVVVVRTRQRG